MNEVGFNFIQNTIKSLLSQVDFDTAVLLKHPEFKKGMQSFAIAAKAAAKAPFDIDDKIIDQLVLVLEGVIDQQKSKGVIEVGAAPDEMTWRPKHSRQEVEDAIRAEGGDPKTFAPWVLIALQFAPMLIDLIRKLMGK